MFQRLARTATTSPASHNSFGNLKERKYMSHSDQGDHWDFLAADLGASSLPEEKEEDQETKEEQPEEIQEALVEPTDELPAEEEEPGRPAEETPTPAASEKPKRRSRGQKGDRVVSGFGYRRGSVDWANLARELGVEAMEEAPAPIPAAEAVEEASFVVDTAAVFDVEEEVEETKRKEPSPQPIASEFGAGLLDAPLPEATTEPVGETEAGDTEEAAQEERKGRRRRRRRKPRKSEEEQGSEAPAVASETTVVAEEMASAAQEETRQEEEEEEGGRRRGRRRGGRKRGSREQTSSDSQKFGPSMVPHEAGGSDTDDFDLLLGDDDETEEADEASGTDSRGQDRDEKAPKKVTHRGIPSWEEAVGHIVDTNMEGRSKKPDSSGYRQRPGRRRGGDRSGNRGRS